MRSTPFHRGAVLLAAIIATAAPGLPGPARAQERHDGDTTPRAATGPTTGTPLVDPSQGGVAGTGLGKSPPAGDAPGTGMSVKGPAGQDVKELPAKP